MSNVRVMPSNASAEATDGDEMEVAVTEYLLGHPRWKMLLQTVVAAVCFLSSAAADWLAVFHLMSLKFTDAMGNPIGDTSGLIAMSGVTLVGYVLIGYAFDRPGRAAKMAALGLYCIVLILLGLAIAPVETPTLREVWSSLSIGGTFGGANAADDAPTWFLLPCITALTMAFSLFGIVFLVAKAWLWHLLDLWQYRGHALITMQQFADDRAERIEASRRAETLAILDDAAFAEAVLQTVHCAGLEAYRDTVSAQIAVLQTALKDVRHPKAEQQRLKGQLDAAKACLKSVQNA